jgi:predicted flap endonuclease-1-like 5' DNA nuclease
VLDPSRFERALIGPDFNEGVPRNSVVEIRPSVLPPVTDIYRPAPPPPPPIEEPLPELPATEEVVELPEPQPEPVPEPEPRRGGLAARLRDATTSAAAGAVAAAKAAAAASVTMPGMGLSRRERVEERIDDAPSREPEVIAAEAGGQRDDSGVVHDEPAQMYEDATEEAVEEAAVVEPLEAVVEDPQAEFAPEPEAEPETEPEPELEPELTAEPEPVAEPAPAPVAATPVSPAPVIEGGDDFQRIRAINGDIEQKLKSQGITYFEHIAAWSASDIKRIGQELAIPGRIDREQWVEQAQILAKGGETYYSRNRKAVLKAAAASTPTPTDDTVSPKQGGDASAPARTEQTGSPPATGTGVQRDGLSGVAAASQGRSVAEMAAAAAAAIAAASSSVTRGLKPIEPISPLSKVNPKISMPARITDAIREKESSAASVEISKEQAAPDVVSDATPDGPSDDLKRIRGIGVLIEKRLNALGVHQYDQIANWTSGDIDRVSRMLEFKGRIKRESWVEQARILASGGYTEFSRRVDRGEVDTSRET